jgi:hypothetical protein
LTFPPWLAFALVASLAIALLYQLFSRRVGWRLVLYWLLVLCGFLAGEILAESFDWNVTRFGDLRLLPDLLGAAAILTGLRVLGI